MNQRECYKVKKVPKFLEDTYRKSNARAGTIVYCSNSIDIGRTVGIFDLIDVKLLESGKPKKAYAFQLEFVGCPRRFD